MGGPPKKPGSAGSSLRNVTRRLQLAHDFAAKGGPQPCRPALRLRPCGRRPVL